MSDLHKLILKEAKPLMEKKFGDSLTDIEFYKMMFVNFRHKNGEPHGLRLTGVGNNLLQRVYDAYTYHITGDVNHQAYILLDMHMVWPYYVGRKLATFYSDNDAAWFRLNNSDLKLYTEHL